MSLRYEQYRSIQMTREFLSDILTVDRHPKTRTAMRDRASRCLKHYPMLHDNGQPMWSQDEFTEDR